MNWSITEVYAIDGLITKAKYHCVEQTVETEGYWTFQDPKLNTPFADVTEEMVIAWVDSEIGPTIKAQLDEQLQTQMPVVAPWIFGPRRWGTTRRVVRGRCRGVAARWVAGVVAKASNV